MKKKYTSLRINTSCFRDANKVKISNVENRSQLMCFSLTHRHFLICAFFSLLAVMLIPFGVAQATDGAKDMFKCEMCGGKVGVNCCCMQKKSEDQQCQEAKAWILSHTKSYSEKEVANMDCSYAKNVVAPNRGWKSQEDLAHDAKRALADAQRKADDEQHKVEYAQRQADFKAQQDAIVQKRNEHRDEVRRQNIAAQKAEDAKKKSLADGTPDKATDPRNLQIETHSMQELKDLADSVRAETDKIKALASTSVRNPAAIDAAIRNSRDYIASLAPVHGTPEEWAGVNNLSAAVRERIAALESLAASVRVDQAKEPSPSPSSVNGSSPVPNTAEQDENRRRMTILNDTLGALIPVVIPTSTALKNTSADQPSNAGDLHEQQRRIQALDDALGGLKIAAGPPSSEPESTARTIKTLDEVFGGATKDTTTIASRESDEVRQKVNALDDAFSRPPKKSSATDHAGAQVTTNDKLTDRKIADNRSIQNGTTPSAAAPDPNGRRYDAGSTNDVYTKIRKGAFAADQTTYMPDVKPAGEFKPATAQPTVKEILVSDDRKFYLKQYEWRGQTSSGTEPITYSWVEKVSLPPVFQTENVPGRDVFKYGPFRTMVLEAQGHPMPDETITQGPSPFTAVERPNFIIAAPGVAMKQIIGVIPDPEKGNPKDKVPVFYGNQSVPPTWWLEP